jgi:hypothetical protein
MVEIRRQDQQGREHTTMGRKRLGHRHEEGKAETAEIGVGSKAERCGECEYWTRGEIALRANRGSMREVCWDTAYVTRPACYLYVIPCFYYAVVMKRS